MSFKLSTKSSLNPSAADGFAFTVPFEVELFDGVVLFLAVELDEFVVDLLFAGLAFFVAAVVDVFIIYICCMRLIE